MPVADAVKSVAQDRDGFRVTLSAVHTHAEAGFRWCGRIEGTATGLSFTVDGVVLRDFYHNRIGICVLHPLSLAGTSVALETPSGPAIGAFPVRITGHRVLGPFTALRHPVGRRRPLPRPGRPAPTPSSRWPPTRSGRCPRWA